MKKRIVIAWLMLLFAAISGLFWHNEWVYSLPTPVPKDYRSVNPGQVIDLGIQSNSNGKKPLFLHFFNPDCPCSRFNISHFKSLVKEYGNRADFRIVVMSNQVYTVKEIQSKFETGVPVLFDTAIAVACGVYSTPQAVIIDATHKLFYRGNYNKSRYCADKKSEYARMALDSLLHQHLDGLFDRFALKAYGCQLPNCTK
ncbi:MAG TPA: thioredoxin fold domain-containing protein [Puia sp.]|nr:thioredoxin fold domain-containing protein [Puia sp.]